jgi:porin
MRGAIGWALNAALACAILAPSSASASESDPWQRDSLTGSWSGLRDELAQKGIVFGADAIDDLLGNVEGGVRSGATYQGRLEVLATIDLDRAVGWRDATFHANAFFIHGRGLSANYLDNNLMTVSNIDATRSVRLFTCWIEQAFFKHRLSVRIGQIAADDEFFISQYGSLFANATFGWPTVLAAALPSGGPVYPLATPGIRLNFAVSTKFSVSAALFNGNPSGPTSGDPQAKDADGLAFRTGDDAFFIAEVAYSVNQDKYAPGLPASYKIGVWSHTSRFADLRFDSSGTPLASPESSGLARRHRGDFGAYVVLDQFLWRRGETADQGLAMFVRFAGAPSDRNLVSLYGDIGLTLKGPFAGRADDAVGVGFAYARIGDAARGFDRDTRLFTGLSVPVRDFEAALELTYRYQAAPWLALQFDVQRIFHPGGDVALPDDPSLEKRVSDATVLGLRSAIVF